MREVVISKPSTIVLKALHGGLGKIWCIIIITDDKLGVTFQISKNNLKKHRVKERLACWAKKNWIRAGIVAQFMVTNTELATELEKMYRSQGHHLDVVNGDEEDEQWQR